MLAEIGLIPIYRYTSTIDVGRCLVLEILESSVARFLELVSVESEV